jgi:LAO/AO transport system kinase
LVDRFRAGDRMALARVITLVENQEDGFEDVLHDIHKMHERTWRIGVTGPPGAGKSTTVEKLAMSFREDDRTVGIVAIDPSSPFSGGALLGDRIRMSRLNLDPGIYIRSLATRGSVGGLTAMTEEVIHVLEAFGFDIIMIETVGVGQSELDIASQADSTVVILVPESGDSIQILKAGLLEIADILVVNKSDRSGADALAANIEEILDMRDDHSKWREKVIQTTSSSGDGIDILKRTLEEHWSYLSEGEALEAGRRKRVKDHIMRIIERRIEELINGNLRDYHEIDGLIDRIMHDETTPYRVADMIMKDLGLMH